MKKQVAIQSIIAFLIPVSILVFVMLHRNMLPFGDIDFLLWDMDIQYKNIYCWFYDVLHGNASLFYDFSKSLGGNMYSVFSCYLASPINLLVYFFPPENMMYFLALATILKIALCGLTCYFYLKKRWNIDTYWIVLIFSTAYALMEYNVSLCSNLHFLDGIYMLPLVALGVYQLVYMKKGILLFVSISYCLFTNWYIGYMCCYFSVFYFGFEVALYKNKFREIIAIIKTYMWYMFLGVLGGAITFIPSALASMNGKGQLDISALLKGFHNNIFIPLKGFYISSLGNVNYDEPAIYVGGFVCVCVIFYFLNTKANIREKIAAGFILIFVFISFSFVPLEIMWTMLKRTRSFHFRYAFVFSFLLIMVAAACWKKIEKHNIVVEKKAVVVSAIFVVILGITGNGFRNDLNSKVNLIFLTVFVLEIVVLFLYISKTNKKLKWLCAFFIIVSFIVEMFYNTNAAFKRYSHSSEKYRSYVQTMEHVIDTVKDMDPSFYRMEKTISSLHTARRPFPPAAAEALMFNYNGIIHYSSFYDSKVDELLGAMGYCKPDAMWSNYCDTNIVGDSLLGIKYVIANKKPAYMEPLSTAELPLQSHLYQNPYALPWGFMVDEHIINIQYTMDPFKNQELILSQILGEQYKVYYEQKVEEIGNKSQWEITVRDSGAVYAYFMGDHNETALYVNGEYVQPYYSRAYKNIIYLGMHERGDTILLSFDETNCKKNHNLKAVTVNKEAFEMAIKKIQSTGFEPIKVQDRYILGEYTSNKKETIMLSIPYDPGWTIELNGKKIPYKEILNSMIAIDIPDGKSVIQLKYTPPFLHMSVMLTCMGVILFFFTEVGHKRKERKKSGQN